MKGACNGIGHPIMVVGSDRLSYSVVCGLLNAGHPVLLLAADSEAAKDFIVNEVEDSNKLHVVSDWPANISSKLIVMLTPDKAEIKEEFVRQVEQRASEQAVIAVNLESICLSDVQRNSVRPSRIFGLNWTYPVHRTFFAEIIADSNSDEQALAQLEKWVTTYWGKDPYVARKGFSIRARLMAAMLREGLYLIENDFASIESVDRACRNDAGYYLPFAGNFRYMDLMGTYAYGMVMKDLNKELSNMVTLPKILQEKRRNGEVGMDAGKGFYTYSSEEKVYWESIFKEFSQEIQQLITKYSHETLDY
ncbi:MAG TPA: 3-hydroxyacyl-CoA dehydrogenase family protein [Sphingobacterium sp.]|nr:3-hydroxyacyl-CoA dehydrogenase family protein [Sphingobacterium sp.]